MRWVIFFNLAPGLREDYFFSSQYDVIVVVFCLLARLFHECPLLVREGFYFWWFLVFACCDIWEHLFFMSTGNMTVAMQEYMTKKQLKKGRLILAYCSRVQCVPEGSHCGRSLRWLVTSHLESGNRSWYSPLFSWLSPFDAVWISGPWNDAAHTYDGSSHLSWTSSR